MTIAVDFDDTLNFHKYIGKKYNPNFKLISFLRKIKKDDDFFLVTARSGSDSNRSFISEFMNLHNLKPLGLYFTNREEKGPILEQLAVDFLIDDNESQRNSSIEYGIDAYHPDDLIYAKDRKSEIKNYLQTSLSPGSNIGFFDI